VVTASGWPTPSGYVCSCAAGKGAEGAEGGGLGSKVEVQGRWNSMVLQ